MSADEKDKITWKWIAGISGILLFALATAWAARVESAVAKVDMLGTSIQYIQRDVSEIKDIMREALRR